MRKNFKMVVVGVLVAFTLVACSAAAAEDVTVVSREEGSGTRGAFVELFGIEEKDASGEKVDNTIATADQTNSTGVMLQSVAQNELAIGYVSMGALNDTVKALEIDGAKPSIENVSNGSYKVSRPFNIVTNDDVSEVTQDFINYILSSDGQKIVEDNGYIASTENEDYSGTSVSGKIVIAGSSSVSPVMEKLVEGYEAINDKAEIELQTSDSTTGVNSVVEKICDIGMASRELKDSEKSQGVSSTVIALDGIAVIVNNANQVNGLTSDQVKQIYTGNIVTWNDVK